MSNITITVPEFDLTFPRFKDECPVCGDFSVVEEELVYLKNVFRTVRHHCLLCRKFYFLTHYHYMNDGNDIAEMVEEYVFEGLPMLKKRLSRFQKGYYSEYIYLVDITLNGKVQSKEMPEMVYQHWYKKAMSLLSKQEPLLILSN